MLTHICIRDFAIAERLELECGDGMTALTGETGAGKSILVDALGLALGARADSTVVRHGCERADISASFDLTHIPEARNWLAAQDLDQDGECVLRRVIGREGRSRAYVNGAPLPLQQVRTLGDWLVEIHGQHEHQSLLGREHQRRVLDDFGANADARAVLTQAYDKWRELSRRLEQLSIAGKERQDRLELLRFQVAELVALDLVEGESDSLDEEHAKLAHAGRLLEGSQSALSNLYDDEHQSAYQLARRALVEIEGLAEIDSGLNPVTELLSSAAIQMQEAADELQRYVAQVELDPARLQWLDTRIGALHAMARKHQLAPRALPEQAQRLARELDELDGADQHVEALQAERDAAEHRYREVAATLSAARQAAARTLSGAVTESMQRLGMDGGQFHVDVLTDETAGPTPHGLDTVEFSVSANPGQPLKPLSKVASGGELSRISLAIQVITANAARVPTLIFDEVDTGIGGGTAEVVGRLLRELGSVNQVLCVTHLPQVAAQAHEHLVVSKSSDAESTRIAIATLDAARRVQEVARMLGGVEVTKQTLKHAQEMIERACDG